MHAQPLQDRTPTFKPTQSVDTYPVCMQTSHLLRLPPSSALPVAVAGRRARQDMYRKPVETGFTAPYTS